MNQPIRTFIGDVFLSSAVTFALLTFTESLQRGFVMDFLDPAIFLFVTLGTGILWVVMSFLIGAGEAIPVPGALRIRHLALIAFVWALTAVPIYFRMKTGPRIPIALFGGSLAALIVFILLYEAVGDTNARDQDSHHRGGGQ